MKDWHVGQRVVCVSDFDSKEIDFFDTIYPVKGQILTIRDIDKTHKEIGFLFEEIINEKEEWREGYFEASFICWRFRPLDESRLDQFRVHLNPKKVEEKIDA